MKIYFASDHAGFLMKDELIPFVKSLGFEVEDCGAFVFNKEDDYPDFIKKAAEAVSKSPFISNFSEIIRDYDTLLIHQEHKLDYYPFFGLHSTNAK